MRKTVETTQDKRKLQRLALIKDRYRKLVLQPRYQLDMQLRDVFDEEVEFDYN